MVFPATILDLRAELLLGGAWTDISTYVYQNRSGPGITITRGHADESTVTSPTLINAVVANPDGRFSDLNPTGPYYGLIGQNTPLRVSVPEGASYLRSETDQASYASCPDSAGVSVTGDTEIQLDVTLDNWQAAQSLASKWTSAGNQRSWIVLLNEAGTLTFSWSPDGTAIVSATSTLPVPFPALGRQAVKVTVAVASGTVTFWTAPAAVGQVVLGPITSGWVQLGAAVVAGANNVFDSTAAVAAGYAPGDTDYGYAGIYGKVHRFALLSGIGGTVKASPDFTVQSAGATSFADAQANTWTLAGTAEISARRYRGYGELSALPQGWDASGTDVYVSLTASGLLRRMQQGSPPALPALDRYWAKLTGVNVPVAWWPMEDQAGSTQLASGLPGGLPMTVTSGTPSLAADSSFACSAPLPQLNNAVLFGPIAGYTDTGTIVIRFPFCPHGAGGITDYLLNLATTGTAAAGQLYLLWSAGTLSVNSGPTVSVADGKQVMVSVELTPSGGNIQIDLRVMALTGVITSATTSFLAGTTGRLLSVLINSGADNWGSTVIGQIAVQSALVPLSGLLGPLTAWAGEAAGGRFQRLCAEEGIAFRGQGRLSATVPMGTQTPQAVVALLQECADADRGVILEPRQVLGLGYRTSASLTAQAAAVALSYAHADLPADPGITPARDDQNLTNDVTVSRAGGSSARARVTTGPLSVLLPAQGGAGPYATAVTLNPAWDSWCAQLASWLAHMGSVNEPRYPVLPVDLGRPEVAAVYYDLQDVDLGDKITVSVLPVWLPPDGISQLAQGSAEQLGGYTYQIGWNAVPSRPWDTAVAGTAHADTDGSTLHTAVTSGATTMQVDTIAGAALWTTSAGDFPIDIKMGGERITVTGILGPPGNFLTGDATGFESGIANWSGSTNCSAARSTAQAHTGVASLAITSVAAGNMAAASCTAGNILTQGMPCLPGDSITALTWFFAATVARSCNAGIEFFTAAGASLGSHFGSNVTDSTVAWTLATLTFTAPATSAFCRTRPQVQATAAGGEVHYVDDVLLGPANSQSFAVTRSVNGIVKAHTAGEAIVLFATPVVALA